MRWRSGSRRWRTRRPTASRDWLAGLDAELVALILRRGARIYDLTQGDGARGVRGDVLSDARQVLRARRASGSRTRTARCRPRPTQHDRAAVIIRLVDSLYRTDKDLARRLLVAATGELDSELEETAYRWQRGRMADLGFADYYEALEVYRELDLGERAHRRGEAAAAAGDGRRRGRRTAPRCACRRRSRSA